MERSVDFYGISEFVYKYIVTSFRSESSVEVNLKARLAHANSDGSTSDMSRVGVLYFRLFSFASLILGL